MGIPGAVAGVLEMTSTDTSAPININTPLLLTASQVAKALGVPEDTIRNLHRVNTLKGVLCGKHLRWRPADVRAYVAALGDS